MLNLEPFNVTETRNQQTYMQELLPTGILHAAKAREPKELRKRELLQSLGTYLQASNGWPDSVSGTQRLVHCVETSAWNPSTLSHV